MWYSTYLSRIGIFQNSVTFEGMSTASNSGESPAEDIPLPAPGLAVQIIVYPRNIVFMGINPDVFLWQSNPRYPPYPLILQFLSTIAPCGAPE